MLETPSRSDSICGKRDRRRVLTQNVTNLCSPEMLPDPLSYFSTLCPFLVNLHLRLVSQHSSLCPQGNKFVSVTEKMGQWREQKELPC